MSKFTESLNPQQKAAALHTKGPLSIVAGAGSGKTRTLTHKLGYLIEDKGIDPYKILAITFTNKAANEMKDRVISLVGEKAKPATISTYHSLCVRILRKEITFFDYPKNFNIIDNIDQKQVLRPLYKRYNLSPKTFSFNSMIKYISTEKMRGNSPEILLDNANSDLEKISSKVYRDYIDSLKKAKSLDFDDLLIFVSRLFFENKDAADRWSKRFDYVLVDEFQDTSHIQYNIIKTLASSGNITIVGDPDQTIYTWRNADATLIQRFNNDFPKAVIVKLEQNYRSTKTILDAANKLIKYNTKREEKVLFSDNEKGEPIEFYHGFSDDAEGRWIAEKIKEIKLSGTPLKNIAVLYRANYVSQALERQFIKANLNYIIYGGIKFYQRQEIKDCIAYLKLINNNDDVSMDRMINIPSRKLGAVALEKLSMFARSKKMSLTEALFNANDELPITSTQKSSLNAFLNNINKHRVALNKNTISDVLDSFIKNVNYISTFNTIEGQTRVDNIKQLIKSIKEWEKINPGKTLHDYLMEISLYTDSDQETPTKDYISLMTTHAAKGLEFDHVFIASFSEGVFPSARAIDEGGEASLQEERRLAYVAVTRAKKKIFISNSKGYTIDFKTQKKPSRFIAELGIDVREHTTSFIAPKNISENYEGNRNILEGDKVSHIKFGEGVVVNLQGDVIEISFKAPYGLKSMMKNHKSIKVVE